MWTYAVLLPNARPPTEIWLAMNAPPLAVGVLEPMFPRTIGPVTLRVADPPIDGRVVGLMALLTSEIRTRPLTVVLLFTTTPALPPPAR